MVQGRNVGKMNGLVIWGDHCFRLRTGAVAVMVLVTASSADIPDQPAKSVKILGTNTTPVDTDAGLKRLRGERCIGPVYFGSVR